MSKGLQQEDRMAKARGTWDMKARARRGAQARRQVFGAADEAAWKRSNDEFDPEFHDIMVGFRWGTITARPGIDMRTRMLCRVAAFLAQGNLETVDDIVENHIRGALRSGATPQEVVEVILETGLAAGIHKWKARTTAVRVFKEMGYRQGVDWGRPLPKGW
jgi:alkylhydroperoxidase/carboxymuconolactone decarboxylase family protein YurZ